MNRNALLKKRREDRHTNRDEDHVPTPSPAKSEIPRKSKAAKWNQEAYWGEVEEFVKLCEKVKILEVRIKSKRPELGDFLKMHGVPQDPVERPDDHMIDRPGLRTRWLGTSTTKVEERALIDWAKENMPGLLSGINWALYDQKRAAGEISNKAAKKWEKVVVGYTFRYWILAKQQCDKCGADLHKKNKFCPECGASRTEKGEAA